MSGLLLSLVTVFFRGLPSLMDCNSWSLACSGLLPPFLLAPVPNIGGGPDGGGGGGGPDRAVEAGGGGGGGGGNGIAVCGRAGKTDKNKQCQVSRTGHHYDGRTNIRLKDRRSEDAVCRGRTVCVMCVGDTAGPTVNDGTTCVSHARAT